MLKQNKNLFIILALVGLVVLFVARDRIFSSGHDSDTVAAEDETAIEVTESTQDNMGDPVGGPQGAQAETGETVAAVNTEDRKNFSLIATDLMDCFDLRSESLPEEMPLQMEALTMQLQKPMGPANGQFDRWMNWHLRLKDGTEKRMRLEVNTMDDGLTSKELKYYSVDAEGLPVPMQLEESKRFNPSDEVLNQMLREGEVLFKERAAATTFVNGASVDYIEKDGVLTEFEFQNANRYFRCQNLKNRNGCQCIR